MDLRRFLLSGVLLIGCSTADRQPSGGRSVAIVLSGATCSDGECIDSDNNCVACMCGSSPDGGYYPMEETPAMGQDGGTVGADGGTVGADGGTVGADGGTPGVDGGTPDVDGGTVRIFSAPTTPSPCNSPPYTGANGCANLIKMWPLGAGCRNLSNHYNGPVPPNWSPSWLMCHQSRAPIINGCDSGTCPANVMDCIQGLVNTKCADCASAPGCLSCLIDNTRQCNGSGPVCGISAACMDKILKDWYPGNCSVKCNTAEMGTHNATHAWIECTIGGRVYSFDGNGGNFYDCPAP